MKAHTNDYKNEIKKFGKQLDSKITYTLDGDNIELGMEDLNSITPTFQGDILKSVMKQLDIDSNVEIPVGTTINYQFGVLVNEEYEYIDFGNYIVQEVEKQEDLNSYKITCYDKMLYSMVDYEELQVQYPITIRNYLNAICQKLGITFASVSDTFANYNRQIQSDLYKDLGYTYRDVLDEIAEATGSTICINSNDALEVRYITDTHDTINEDFLKNINVTFGEKYGPVNSIVLSRSAESDNVYIQDEQSIAQNGLCEIKIKDNQIMNFNDRSDYLPDLLAKLGGLEYYLNDYSSPGITYYDLCDRYSVEIGENTYSCVMLNDEINVTQGLEENVHTDIPEPSETDYKKADKTDQRINQTYLIVDKQNQIIESVVSNVSAQDDKISQITQTVDEINSKISDIADITTSAEDTDGQIELQDINESNPIQIKVRPVITNISYDYPQQDYPQNDYSKIRTIRFYNSTDNEVIYDYELPEDLLYYDSDNYDEFLLDYGDGSPETQICQVTKKCKWNADGTVGLLSTPEIHSYPYPEINLTDGDYVVSILAYGQGYIFARLMAKNIYTTQFYTKAETNSIIDQTANSINLSVDTKLSNYSTTSEMNAAISVKANEITSSVSETYATKTTTNQLSSRITQNADNITSEVNRATTSEGSLSSRISQTAKGISLTVNNGSTTSGITITTTKEDGTTTTTSGTIQMNGLVKFTDLSNAGSTTINGSNITTGTIKSSNYVSGSAGTSINLSTGAIDTKNFKVSSSGNITATGGKIGGFEILSNRMRSTNKKTGMSSSNVSSDPAFWAGHGDPWEDSNWASNTPFYVTNDGYLRATNVSISGYVNATSGNFSGGIYSSYGEIGGWNIGGSRLYGTSAGHQFAIAPYGVEDETASTSVGWARLISLSDKNAKSDIKSIENKFETFYDNLKPVTFYYKEGIRDDKKHFGFIAQDILKNEENINEELSMVEKPEKSKYYNLYKDEIIALNTWQIQKLKKQVNELTEKLEGLING